MHWKSSSGDEALYINLTQIQLPGCSEEGRREMSGTERRIEGREWAFSLHFPKMAAVTPSSPCSLPQWPHHEEKPSSPPLLNPRGPVTTTSRLQQTGHGDVPPTALACLEVSVAFCRLNVHYGWNQMPHKKSRYLGTPIPWGSPIQSCEEAVWTDCSSHPRQWNQNIILHTQLSRAFRWPNLSGHYLQLHERPWVRKAPLSPDNPQNVFKHDNELF